MGKSRKDAVGNNPIESYRKQIGNQDYKKSKDDLRHIKEKAKSRDDAPQQYKNVILMIVLLLLLFVFGYALFFGIVSTVNKKSVDH